MSEITKILQAVEAGDTGASEPLLPLAYDELRRDDDRGNRRLARRLGEHHRTPMARRLRLAAARNCSRKRK